MKVKVGDTIRVTNEVWRFAGEMEVLKLDPEGKGDRCCPAKKHVGTVWYSLPIGYYEDLGDVQIIRSSNEPMG